MYMRVVTGARNNLESLHLCIMDEIGKITRLGWFRGRLVGLVDPDAEKIGDYGAHRSRFAGQSPGAVLAKPVRSRHLSNVGSRTYWPETGLAEIHPIQPFAAPPMNDRFGKQVSVA
jgi:hypothetical protein